MTRKCAEPTCKDGNAETEVCEITEVVEEVNPEQAFLAFLNTGTKSHEMTLAKDKFLTAM